MRLTRFFNFACAFVLLGTLVAAPAASLASDMAAVSTTILDSKDQPVSGARVVFTGSAGTTFSTHTDKHGLATINLPVDTYTIVASRNGYSSESLGHMNIAANTTLSMTIVSAPSAATNAAPAMHQSAGVAPARTVAAVPSSAQPAVPPPPLVHDALLATYNAHQPEHARGEPYYGRYTYVLLAGTGPNDPRNRALVAALVAKYGVAANGGKQTVIGNPFGYNIFFMPVTGSGQDVAAASATTDALLAAYDYKTARYLHDRYCAAGNHAGNPICTKPLAQGPFMLTLTRPLEGLKARDAFPPAFAYDFSGVAPDQYPAAVAIVARTTSVPEPMQADLELPVADLTKYVGPALVATSDQMHRMVPSAKVYVDTALAALAN
jgi:Carboxypeptidase regulatory-like domain